MAKQHIKIGDVANDRTGDPLREAFRKVNENFDELYSTDGLTKYHLGDDIQFVDIDPVTGTVVIQSGYDTGMPVYIKGANCADGGTGGNVVIEAGGPPVGQLITGTTGNVEIAGNDITIDAGGGVTTFASGDGTPYVTFPAVNGSQLGIQGSEISSLPGSEGLALSARESSIILSTHGDQYPSLPWEFDRSGTINTPLFFPKTFTALLLPVYGGAPNIGPYGGNAWEIGVTFNDDGDGIVRVYADNIFPILNNPGYKTGDSWTFHEADHGIPGYTFTLSLSNVVYPGGAGWTANILTSEPPAYTPTIQSPGTIKITAGTESWTFDTNGKLTLPVGGDILDSNGLTVLGGTGGGLSISDFGRGFTNTLDSGKITTNKLYNRPANLSLNNHFELSVDDGGVVHLPDQSIINGATLKSVPGNYAGITAGPIGKDEDSWVWVDSDGAWIATDYSNNAFTWQFNNDGELVLPVTGAAALITSLGGTIQIQPKPGTIDLDVNGGDLLLYAGAADTEHNASGGSIHILATSKNIVGPGGDPTDGIVDITTAGGVWTFGDNGVLTLAGVPTPNFFGDHGTIYYNPSGWFPIQTVGPTTHGIPGHAGGGAWKFNKTLYEFDFTTLKPDDILMLDAVDVGYSVPPSTQGYPASITLSYQDPDNADLWIIGLGNAGPDLPDGTTMWLKYGDENIFINEVWGFSNSTLTLPSNAKFKRNDLEWTFGDDGTTTMPLNGDTLLNYGHLYFGDYGVGTNMFVDEGYNLQIYTNTGGQRGGNWIFKTNGDTVLPGNINNANSIDIKIGTGVYNSSANSVSNGGTQLHIAKVVDEAIGDIVKPGWQISTSWGGHIAKVTFISEGTGSFGPEWIFVIDRDISAGFVGGGQVTFGILESTWTFGENGNLILPAGANITHGDVRLSLNLDEGNAAYLTTTIDDTTALYLTTTGVQLYAGQSVSLQAGESLAALESVYNEYIIQLANAFEAEGWVGAGYPAGHYSYYALQQAKATNPLISDYWITLSKAGADAWDAWQIALDATNIIIGVAGNEWTFGNNGKITLPTGGDIVDSEGETVLGFASTSYSLSDVLSTILANNNNSGVIVTGNVAATFPTGTEIQFESLAGAEFTVSSATYDPVTDTTGIIITDYTGFGPVDGDKIYIEYHGVQEIYAGTGIALGVTEGNSGRVLTIAATPTSSPTLTLQAKPTTKEGQLGDLRGMTAIDPVGGDFYYCINDYTDGQSAIWAKVTGSTMWI